MANIDPEQEGSVTFDAFNEKLRSEDPAWKKRQVEKAKEREARRVAATTGINGLFSLFGADPVDDEDEDEDDEGAAGGPGDGDGDAAKGANFFEPGTPVMAQHSSGDFFRATVTKDNLDGSCDVQFVLATLGRDAAKSKKKIRSLAQEDELRALWLDVSRTVGRRGAAELRTKGDYAGSISHEALLLWLDARDMDEISEHDKFVILADIDPLHSGAISVARFVEKLEHFRARAKILGLAVFHRHDKEVAPDSDDDDGDGGEGGGREKADKAEARPEAGGPSGGAGGGLSAASQARMAELEALIFSMAKRQQELALALSASEVAADPAAADPAAAP
jgi:hypothetical protein